MHMQTKGVELDEQMAVLLYLAPSGIQADPGNRHVWSKLLPSLQIEVQLCLNGPTKVVHRSNRADDASSASLPFHSESCNSRASTSIDSLYNL